VLHFERLLKHYSEKQHILSDPYVRYALLFAHNKIVWTHKQLILNLTSVSFNKSFKFYLKIYYAEESRQTCPKDKWDEFHSWLCFIFSLVWIANHTSHSSFIVYLISSRGVHLFLIILILFYYAEFACWISKSSCFFLLLLHLSIYTFKNRPSTATRLLFSWSDTVISKSCTCFLQNAGIKLSFFEFSRASLIFTT